MHKWRNLRTSPYSQREENLIPTTPHPSPPIRYPISYSILDPITRLLLSFKACSEERGIPDSNRSLSFFLFTLVFIICCLQRALVCLKNSQDITEIRLQRQRTRAHWHTRTFKGGRVYNRLAFWECCPCAFVCNKLNNLRLLHEFHIQDTGWISSLKHETMYVLNERISKEVLGFRFFGNTTWNPRYPAGCQHAWELQSRGI